MNVTHADNANGTGYTATVTDTGGAAVTVYYTPADRPWPGDAWAVGGTRVGDGAVVVPVDPRFYFGYAATATEITPPDRFAVTDGWDEPASVLQDALAALLATLALPSQNDFVKQFPIGDERRTGVKVLTQLHEDASEREYPCLTVTAADATEQQEKGTNCLDDIVYTFPVMLFDAQIGINRQWSRKWVQYVRSKVSKAVRNQHSLGVPSLVQARVRYRQVSVKRQDNIDGAGGGTWAGYAGGFSIECVNREPRGLGA